MVEAIIMFISLLFIVCGMFFVCGSIYNLLFSSKFDIDYNVIIVGKPGDNNLSQKVYSAFVQMNLMNFSKRNEIIVLDLGISERVKRECYKVMEQKGRVVFIDEKTLPYFFLLKETIICSIIKRI